MERIAEILETQPRDFREQPFRVAEMMRRCCRRNAGAPRHFPQRKPVDAAFEDQGFRRPDQFLAQIAMMIRDARPGPCASAPILREWDIFAGILTLFKSWFNET